MKHVYTWGGLKTIGGRNGRYFCISYVGKCTKEWEDFYGGLKPWKKFGYSNPIFCIDKKNTGYNSFFERKRVVFFLFWHQIQW